MKRAALIATAVVLCAGVIYFAIPVLWYVVPNHFPPPFGIR